MSLSPDGEAHRAAEQLAELAASGVRLRTRALVTTLFARLFLGDLFMHGIGGAKYDQVTDLLIERFFGLKPPGYMTLTATLRLPIAREDGPGGDIRRVDSELRELTYHPERFLDGERNAEVESLVRQKRQWIDTPRTYENARLRHQAIHSANEGLQGAVAERRAQLLDERSRIAGNQRTQSILASREYAFCLYPAEELRQFMQAAGTR